MSAAKGSLTDLTRRLCEKAPEYLDLITAATEEEFDNALIPLLAKAVEHMETNSKNFRRDDENGLTASFIGKLSNIGLIVTPEANSNGHVDITIEGYLCVPVQKRLGEAKLWKGYKYHVAGLKQLLGYMTGRESTGILLSYVRKQRIEQLVKTLRVDMDKNLPLNQAGKCTDHTLHWSFSSHHRHTSGRNLKISHIACNMYIAETQASRA